MPTTVPPGFLADASIRVWFVPTIADPAAPKVATELNAPAALDITCYLTTQAAPDASVATVTDDRMCLRQVLEDMGTVTFSIDELQYVYDVQNAASVSNKMYAALPQGTTGFLVFRYGKDVDSPAAAGDKVDVFPVRFGPQIKMPGERNSKAKVRQKPFVNGPKQTDVALVA